jgi:hypothetical protein
MAGIIIIILLLGCFFLWLDNKRLRAIAFPNPDKVVFLEDSCELECPNCKNTIVIPTEDKC